MAFQKPVETCRRLLRTTQTNANAEPSFTADNPGLLAGLASRRTVAWPVPILRILVI